MNRHYFFSCALITLLFLLPHYGRAGTVSLQVENDLFSLDDHDRYYTNGTRLSWNSCDSADFGGIVKAPGWMRSPLQSVPFINNTGEMRSVSVSLVQEIYTPDNKRAVAPLLNDRPYAGLAYLGMGLHSKSAKQMSTLEIDLGIVGRHSYAQDAQQAIHAVIHEDDPRGWDNQLYDEPVVNLYGERRWKILKRGDRGGVGFDVIPHAALAAGNAFTGVSLGGELRFGWNIPRNFGTYLLRPGTEGDAPVDNQDSRTSCAVLSSGVHFFLALDGKYVIRNILLDGNTFRDSHSVSKRPFVADIAGGIGFDLYRFRIAYAYVLRTKEFDLQKDDQQFGRISISFTF
jgi:hypothetical protein